MRVLIDGVMESLVLRKVRHCCLSFLPNLRANQVRNAVGHLLHSYVVWSKVCLECGPSISDKWPDQSFERFLLSVLCKLIKTGFLFEAGSVPPFDWSKNNFENDISSNRLVLLWFSLILFWLICHTWLWTYSGLAILLTQSNRLSLGSVEL